MRHLQDLLVAAASAFAMAALADALTRLIPIEYVTMPDGTVVRAGLSRDDMARLLEVDV